MTVGLSSYSYRWSIQKGVMDISGFLQTACELGVPYVQICENLPFATLTREEQSRIRDEFSSRIVIETGYRGSDPDILEKALIATHGLGAKTMRLVIEDTETKTLNLDQVIRNMETILPILEKYDIELCIENHFGLTPKQIRTLIETLNTDRVSVCFDCFNSIALNIGTNEALDELLPFSSRIHIKDVKIKRNGTGFCFKGCPLGTGVLDIPWLLSRFMEAGKDPTIFLEGWIDERPTKEETFEYERQINEDGLLYMRQHVLG